MRKDDLFLIDTNVLIYAYEKENTERKNKAFSIIEKCYKKEIFLALTNQIIAEFSFVAIKKLKMDQKEVKKIIEDIISFEHFKKINYSDKTIISALQISEENKMSFWDSLIVATMLENQISNIYTENIKDFKISSLNVVNPLSIRAHLSRDIV